MSGGIQVLQQAMRGWSVKINTASMAQEMGISSDALEKFATGKGDLPAPILSKLTKLIFADNVEYDAQTDTLQTVPRPEPKTIGYAEMPQCPVGGPFNRNPCTATIQPINPTPVASEKQSRSIWSRIF